MTISKLYYISQGDTPEAHLLNIHNACTSGAELVQLRLKNVDENIILETAKKAREITALFQTRLIINDHYKIAKQVKADGVHLGKSDSCPLEAREHLGKFYIVGGTANTLEDCKLLIQKKVDYIGLGPFRFTETKTNLSPLLGTAGYKKIIDALQKTDTPIIAIGGITLKDVPELIQIGIHGIAVSGEITKDFNNISLFNKLLKTSATDEQVWDRNLKKE